jgi:hypothetical protein
VAACASWPSAGAHEVEEVAVASHSVPVSHVDTVADIAFGATSYVGQLAQGQPTRRAGGGSNSYRRCLDHVAITSANTNIDSQMLVEVGWSPGESPLAFLSCH